jgi:hypothetical protein
MKRSTGYRIAFIIPFLSVSFLAGCSSNTITPESTSLPAGSYYYQLDAANLPQFNASFSQFVLWFQMLGDSTDLSVPISNPADTDGTLFFSGIVKLPHNPDSILSTIVSIEPLTLPKSPSSVLMSGQFQSSDSQSFLSEANASGDYSNAAGSAIFTTKSSDSSRAKQEFYLMKFVNGVPASSMTNLPIAPAGWSYGLWVVDSSFYPIHQFFYGSFTNPNGPGSDSAKAEFPFPGGYNPAPLNDPGASLKVTLEPDFSVAGNKPIGPSPITILWLQLQQFIYFDESLQFQNVWSNSTPSGMLKIWN